MADSDNENQDVLLSVVSEKNSKPDEKKVVKDLVDLLDALDGGDVKKFKSILSRFSDVPHEAVENEGELEAVYYQVLLNVPRSEEVFDDEEIRESLILDEDNYEAILDILFNLNFYSNFQGVIDASFEYYGSTNEFFEYIDECVLEILGIEKYEKLSETHLLRIDEDAKCLNVLKFLLEFKSSEMNEQIPSFKKLSRKLKSTFLEVLDAVSEDSDITETFKKLEDEQECDESLKADTNVLLTYLYLTLEEDRIEEVLKVTRADITELKFRRDWDYKFFVDSIISFAELFASRGYKQFLELIKREDLCDSDCVDLFSSCLKAWDNEKWDESSKLKYNKIPEDYYESDKEATLQWIIDLPHFKDSFEEFNPMEDAIKQDNETAIRKLIATDWWNFEFIGELESQDVEKILDTYITENDEKDIEMDFHFIDDEKKGAELLETIFKNHFLEDLITKHPFLSSYIEMKFYVINFLSSISLFTFLVFFVVSVAYGHYHQNAKAFFIAASYLFVREFIQFYYFHKTSKERQKSMCRWICELFKITFSFFKIRGNLMELVLIIVTIVCGCAVLTLDLVSYRLFLTIIVLLSAIEIAQLLSDVFSSLAIYFFMLQTVFDTFLKTSVVLILYILAFGFCFRVVFQRTFNFKAANITITEPAEDSHELNSFGGWYTTFLKMTLMLSGELDASGLDLSNYISKTLVLGFVLTAILLLNFINALAIADVQELRESGEFLCLKFKFLSIQRFEKFDKLLNKKDEKCTRVTFFIFFVLCGFCRLVDMIRSKAHKTSHQIISKTGEAHFCDSELRKNFQISKKTHGKLKEILKRKANDMEQKKIKKQKSKKFDKLESFADKFDNFEKTFGKDLKESLTKELKGEVKEMKDEIKAMLSRN